jgi:hypothetical protein
MFNNELVTKMEQNLGKEKVIEFAGMITVMYEVLDKENPGTENGYERDWWAEKHKELLKQKQKL